MMKKHTIVAVALQKENAVVEVVGVDGSIASASVSSRFGISCGEQFFNRFCDMVGVFLRLLITKRLTSLLLREEKGGSVLAKPSRVCPRTITWHSMELVFDGKLT